jgi:hypothetical protein
MDSSILSSDVVGNTIFIMFKVLPYFLPILFGYIAWKSWMEYVNTKYTNSITWITLQIVLPKDIAKTPQAMEMIFSNAFQQTGSTGTWWAKYVLGKVRSHFSLEIASIEGNVFFFIRTPSFFKNLIESQIYAQYPTVEILEVDDYVHTVPHNPVDNGWKMWGCEFKLAKDDVYPIKTYIDFGLDSPASPTPAGAQNATSNQIDPMTPLIEFMGHIKKGEQLWMQFIIRAAWDQYHKPGAWFKKRSWSEEGAERVKAIRDKLRFGKDPEAPEKRLTKGEQDMMTALERKITKYGFDVGIRAIYMADKSIFNPINVVGLVGSLKQYGSHDLNSFKPTNVTDYELPWQDPWKRKERRNDLAILHAYRERHFFYTPWSESLNIYHRHHHSFVLNTEELATMYHFPGRVSETPTFKRIESKKVEPPQNLPI